MEMTQDERIDYMLDVLLNESDDYRKIDIKNSDKRRLLRSLMNIRMPKAVTKEFLDVQDEFLKQEEYEKGIIDVNTIPSVKDDLGADFENSDKISVWQGDITRLRADAIVNAANSGMIGCFVPCHRCIDNAIHSAAGIQLRLECYRYMEKQREVFGCGYEEPTGSSVITNGYNLPCKYVIHTVGPIISSRLTKNDRKLLESCYTSCIETAEKNGLESIAFCCISTGEFRFPKKEAADIAIKTVISYLKKHSKIKKVIFDVFSDEDKNIYIEKFINNYQSLILNTSL